MASTLPDEVATARGDEVEPLACVLRGAERVPRGRVLVVGYGSVGLLFGRGARARGDEVVAVDADPAPRRAARRDGPVDAAVLCARGGVDDALARSSPAARCSSSPTPASCPARRGLPARS